MEDFPLLILFFIIYLIAGSAGKKKQKKPSARQNPTQARAQEERKATREEIRNQQVMGGFRDTFPSKADPREADCELSRMHLHEVSGEQMMQAREGEDPCHVSGQELSMPYEAYTKEQDSHQAQDVLRGMIMSEILMRPQERRALQRSRQRTNGY